MTLTNIQISEKFKEYDEVLEYLFKYVGTKKKIKKGKKSKDDEKIYLSTEGLIRMSQSDIV